MEYHKRKFIIFLVIFFNRFQLTTEQISTLNTPVQQSLFCSDVDPKNLLWMFNDGDALTHTQIEDGQDWSVKLHSSSSTLTRLSPLPNRSIKFNVYCVRQHEEFCMGIFFTDANGVTKWDVTSEKDVPNCNVTDEDDDLKPKDKIPSIDKNHQNSELSPKSILLGVLIGSVLTTCFVGSAWSCHVQRLKKSEYEMIAENHPESGRRNPPVNYRPQLGKRMSFARESNMTHYVRGGHRVIFNAIMHDDNLLQDTLVLNLLEEDEKVPYIAGNQEAMIQSLAVTNVTNDTGLDAAEAEVDYEIVTETADDTPTEISYVLGFERRSVNELKAESNTGEIIRSQKEVEEFLGTCYKEGDFMLKLKAPTNDGQSWLLLCQAVPSTADQQRMIDRPLSS